MRFKGLDLNLVICLDALLEERSVSAAARRMFVTQSAMSGALARLRGHFQDELLVPLGRGMVLTDFAEGIVEPIRQLMSQIETTLSVDTTFYPETSRRNFTLAVADYMTELLMPRVARAVAAEAPGVTLQLVAPAGKAAEMIENGTADLTLQGETMISKSHAAELLVEEHYVVVGWSGNPRLTQPLTLETFTGLGRVVARFGPARQLSFAEAQLVNIPGSQKIELVTPSFTSIPHFLVGTHRIAMMHHALAKFHAQRFPLVILDPPFELLPLRVMLQHHAVRSRDAGITWLKALIQSSVREMYGAGALGL